MMTEQEALDIVYDAMIMLDNLKVKVADMENENMRLKKQVDGYFNSCAANGADILRLENNLETAIETVNMLVDENNRLIKELKNVHA